MTTTKHAITNPATVTAIGDRIAYARLPLLQRLRRRPPAGWGGIRRNAPPRPLDGDTYDDLLTRVLAADPTCTGCGFRRSKHRPADGHCPGGDPDDTFTEDKS